MHATKLAGWALAALGVLALGMGPASAAAKGEPSGRQRAAVSAQRQAAAPARGAHMTARANPQAGDALRGTAHAARPGRVRVEAVAPMRGRLAMTQDQQAAVSQGAARGAACSGRHSRCVNRTVNWTRSWTSGLEPADGLQAAECPDGTMATLARGHDDIIRCMPI